MSLPALVRVVVLSSVFVLGTLLSWGRPAAGPRLDCPPCDDGNVCTIDTCDTATGVCRHAGACNDGNPCTFDFCSATQTGFTCSHDPHSLGTCEDGNPCTFGEKCFSGVCTGSLGTDFVCSDSSACTGTDDANAEHQTGLRIGDKFCESVLPV